MSQMNNPGSKKPVLTGAPKQGPNAGTPLTAGAKKAFQPAVNTATVAKNKVSDLKNSIVDNKLKKDAGNAKMNKAIDAVQKGGNKDAQGYNYGMGKGMVDTAKKNISAAKQGIAANTPKGPVMGARTGQNTLTSAGKVGPNAGTPLKAGAVGGAKQVTPFKNAGASNPMGRMGGKPGVNIGTNKK